jgi:hypothetical protein
MRMGLQMAALSLAFVTLVFWLFGGPNLGWTKTTVTHMQIDPITEIEYPVIESRFVPGVDFLAACLGGAAVLFGSSFLFRRK